MGLAPIYEMLTTIADETLRRAFQNATAGEKRAFELVGDLYSAVGGEKVDVAAVVAELTRLVPGLSKDDPPERIAAMAEGFLEGTIARRNGVEKELEQFLISLRH